MRRLRLIFLITLLLSIATMCVEAQPPPPEILISSRWRINPVVLDGRITNGYEWSEALPVDLQLAPEGGGEAVNAIIWILNYYEWLYLLYRIEWPAAKYSAEDMGLIAYVWSVAGNAYSDIGGVRQDGLTFDGYGIEGGGPPKLDTSASPPGENNVQGAGYYDGTHYWFEFRKELDSRDGYDWKLQHGKVYGLGDGSDYVGGYLIMGLRDQDAERSYFTFVKLGIASPPPVGGKIVLINRLAIIAPWITVGLTALAFSLAAVVKRSRRSSPDRGTASKHPRALAG